METQNLRDQRVLLVGIGCSADVDVWSNQAASIVGLTLSSRERIWAEETDIPRYEVHIVNKFDTPRLERLGTFDYIVDAHLNGYACCEAHLHALLVAYSGMLNPGGTLVVGVESGLTFQAGTGRIGTEFGVPPVTLGVPLGPDDLVLLLKAQQLVVADADVPGVVLGRRVS